MERISRLLEDNYFTIMSIISCLYIGLVSFMYPRFIDFQRDLQEKFVDLYNKLNKEFLWHVLGRQYLSITSSFLIFTLICILICILFSIKNNTIYLCLISINESVEFFV